MQVLTYAAARADLKRVMERIVDDHEEVVVARKNGKAVVMSLDAWNSVRETMHLWSTPANARALRDSIAQLDAGKDIARSRRSRSR